jgi:flagellar biosynthesis protein FlhB
VFRIERPYPPENVSCLPLPYVLLPPVLLLLLLGGLKSRGLTKTQALFGASPSLKPIKPYRILYMRSKCGKDHIQTPRGIKRMYSTFWVLCLLKSISLYVILILTLYSLLFSHTCHLSLPELITRHLYYSIKS